MPQTEISNFVETFGQDMLKEATNEFVALDAAGVPAGRFAPLVLYSDGVIVETEAEVAAASRSASRSRTHWRCAARLRICLRQRCSH
jgi:hypothetical protein